MGWKMGGCSDNINFGTQVAQQFLDSSGKYTASKKCFRIAPLHFVAMSEKDATVKIGQYRKSL